MNWGFRSSTGADAFVDNWRISYGGSEAAGLAQVLTDPSTWSTWSGAGANANWGTAENWTGNFAPTNGSDVTFLSGNDSGSTISLDGNRTNGTVTFNNTDATPAATTFNGGVASVWTVNNGILMTNSSADFTVSDSNLSIQMDSDGMFLTNTTSKNLTISAAISGGASAVLTKGGSGTVTLSGANTYSGGTLLSGGTLRGDTTSLQGAITNNAAAIFDTATNGTYAGVMSGGGTVTKTGAGTLTLTATNTYTGATTVSGGTLAVSGSIDSAATVQSGATLAGIGSLKSATIESGGTISPGNSPGTLTLTNGMTWDGGGNYNWQIFDVSDASKRDLIDVTGGTFTLNGLSEVNKFNINLWSLSGIGPDTNGAVYNFDNTQTYSWRIVQSLNTISGTFSNSYFNINTGAVNGTGGFANDLAGGLFALEQRNDGKDLYLVFTPGGAPIPEPGTWAAAALLAGAATFVGWRRRRRE